MVKQITSAHGIGSDGTQAARAALTSSDLTQARHHALAPAFVVGHMLSLVQQGADIAGLRLSAEDSRGLGTRSNSARWTQYDPSKLRMHHAIHHGQSTGLDPTVCPGKPGHLP